MHTAPGFSMVIRQLVSKGNVTIVKEAKLVNRQFDYICATG